MTIIAPLRISFLFFLEVFGSLRAVFLTAFFIIVTI